MKRYAALTVRLPEVSPAVEEWLPDLALFLPTEEGSFRASDAVFRFGLGVAGAMPVAA